LWGIEGFSMLSEAKQENHQALCNKRFSLPTADRPTRTNENSPVESFHP